MGRVIEMNPDEVAAQRVTQAFNETGDRKARGVGRDHRIGLTAAVELLEELALEVRILSQRLKNNRRLRNRARHIVLVGAKRNAFTDSLCASSVLRGLQRQAGLVEVAREHRDMVAS